MQILKKKLRHTAPQEQQKGTLAILAGGGKLPWIAAHNAIQAGEDVRIFPILGSKAEVPEQFQTLCESVSVTKFYSSLLLALKRHNVKRLITLGKAEREILYKGSLDWRIAYLLWRAPKQSDFSFFTIAQKILQKHGIRILSQRLYLQNLFLKEGRYGSSLSLREIQDIVFGTACARQLSQMDIGQTVVVGNRAILALEAAEGSNECIERGGKIFLKKGAVVCKFPRKDHDMRYDIPAIGTETLDTMYRSYCRVLAFDSSRTLITEPQLCVQKAKRYNISLAAIDPERLSIRYLKKLS